jgi:hypothetical protein
MRGRRLQETEGARRCGAIRRHRRPLRRDRRELRAQRTFSPAAASSSLTSIIAGAEFCSWPVCRAAGILQARPSWRGRLVSEARRLPSARLSASMLPEGSGATREAVQAAISDHCANRIEQLRQGRVPELLPRRGRPAGHRAGTAGILPSTAHAGAVEPVPAPAPVAEPTGSDVNPLVVLP